MTFNQLSFRVNTVAKVEDAEKLLQMVNNALETGYFVGDDYRFLWEQKVKLIRFLEGGQL